MWLCEAGAECKFEALAACVFAHEAGAPAPADTPADVKRVFEFMLAGVAAPPAAPPQALVADPDAAKAAIFVAMLSDPAALAAEIRKAAKVMTEVLHLDPAFRGAEAAQKMKALQEAVDKVCNVGKTDAKGRPLPENIVEHARSRIRQTVAGELQAVFPAPEEVLEVAREYNGKSPGKDKPALLQRKQALVRVWQQTSEHKQAISEIIGRATSVEGLPYGEPTDVVKAKENSTVKEMLDQVDPVLRCLVVRAFKAFPRKPAKIMEAVFEAHPQIHRRCITGLLAVVATMRQVYAEHAAIAFNGIGIGTKDFYERMAGSLEWFKTNVQGVVEDGASDPVRGGVGAPAAVDGVGAASPPPSPQRRRRLDVAGNATPVSGNPSGAAAMAGAGAGQRRRQPAAWDGQRRRHFSDYTVDGEGAVAGAPPPPVGPPRAHNTRQQRPRPPQRASRTAPPTSGGWINPRAGRAALSAQFTATPYDDNSVDGEADTQVGWVHPWRN